MSDILGSHESDAGSVTNEYETTKDGRLQIKVNGLMIEVTEQIGTFDLLVKAKGAGAIVGTIEEYVIERVLKDGRHGLEDTITVTAGEEFLAIPTGSTAVA